MCGRFAAGDMTQAQMAAIMNGFLYGTPEISASYQQVTGYNIKPTNSVNCLIQKDGEFELTNARWWFVPHWHRGTVKDWKQTTFNARIESADQKPTFRSAWTQSRCAIPAIGYYEWLGPKGAKVPHYITAKTNAPCLFFAGLSSWRKEEQLHTATILTREAASEIAHIHNRMPILLTGDQISGWLSGDITTTEAKNALGTGWGDRFQFHEVAPIKMDSDGPELIEPVQRLI